MEIMRKEMADVVKSMSEDMNETFLAQKATKLLKKNLLILLGKRKCSAVLEN